MNLNKISCQKYEFEQNEHNASPILEFSKNLHLVSTMKNTNTPLDGAYLVDFGIDINLYITRSKVVKF